jgi:hypothetical protein|tara:strand:- start:230 stop:853 length:624 start_codon:yes stop_codon:yes gene_type:complete
MESTTTVLPLGDESLKKESIIFTVEPAVKELIDNIVHRGENYIMKSKNGDKEIKFKEKYDNYPEVPKTIGGVVLHYVLEGIKADMNIEIKPDPYAIRKRTGSSTRSSSKILSVNAKNLLLDQCSILYWEELGEEDAMEKVMSAMAKVKEWKDKGYYLPKERSKGIMLLESEDYKKYVADKEKVKADRQKRGKELGEDNAQKKKQGAA